LYKFDFHQFSDDLKPFAALLICLLFSCLSVRSQSYNADHFVIANSGDFYDDGTNQLSFTIGETIIQTIGTKSTFLTQGFQQSGFIITNLEELTPFNYQVSTYPNPAGDFLYLETNKEFPMEISVFDLNGRELMHSSSRNKVTQLNFTGMPNAAYLLYVKDEAGTMVKTFQIQKVQ